MENKYFTPDIEDEFICIDYLDESLGIFCEAQILFLKKDGITVLDRQLGEQVEIEFDQLSIHDQIIVLEIYEEN